MMIYNCHNTGTGKYIFQVFGKLYEVLAEYNIFDYSTEQGTMYLVQRADDPTKQMWADDIIQAEDLCKADYKARFE